MDVRFFGKWVNRRWPQIKLPERWDFLCDECKARFIERERRLNVNVLSGLFWFVGLVVVLALIRTLVFS